jgi:Family of unknown function (DUF5681)
MPFARGRSGNPSGRPKFSGEWTRALWRSLERLDPATATRRLELAADRLVDAAIAGDVHALREIGDRIDGKATQPVVASVGVSEGADIAKILERRRARAGLSEPGPLPGEAEG